MANETSIDSRDAGVAAVPEAFGWLCDNALHRLVLDRSRAARTDALTQAEVESAWQLLWLTLDVASAPANSLPEPEAGAEIPWPGDLVEALRAQPLVPKLPAAAWQQLRAAREAGFFQRLPERHTWSTRVPFRGHEVLAREVAAAFLERELAAIAAWVSTWIVGQINDVLYVCAVLIVRQRASAEGRAIEPMTALRELVRRLELRPTGTRSVQPRDEHASRVLRQPEPRERVALGRPPAAASPATGNATRGSPSVQPNTPIKTFPVDIPAAVSGGDDVQFTVFRPKQLAAERWAKLLAFAHLAQRRPDAPADTPDPLAQVQQQAQALLGSEISQYRQLSEDAGQPIPFEGQLTFIPEVPDVKFDPPRASVLWVDDVQRVEFRMQPAAALAGNTARGRLSVFCGSILVADLQLSLPVVTSQSSVSQSFAPPESVRMYRKIFASYSHKDASIVEQFRELAKAFGDRYLIDVSDLRAGERWSEALEKLIREADVFQLFWSWSSMRSEFVRREWEYALQLGRESFIRPTYWEQPMPELPSEGLPPQRLAALHFQPLSLLSQSTPAYTGPRDDVGMTFEDRASPALPPASSKPPASRSSWLRRVVPLSSFLALGAALLFVMTTVRSPGTTTAPPGVEPDVTTHQNQPPITTDPVEEPISVLPTGPIQPPDVPSTDAKPADTKPAPTKNAHKAPKARVTRFPNAEAAKRAFDAEEIDERAYKAALKELEAVRVPKSKTAKPRDARKQPEF